MRGGRRRGHERTPGAVKEGRQVVHGSIAPGHRHHRPHKVPDHVMKIAVRGDLEAPPQPLSLPTPPRRPAGFDHVASVPTFLLPGPGEGPPGAVPREEGGRSVQEFRPGGTVIGGPAERAEEGGSDRRGGSHLVAVRPTTGIEPGVEGRGNATDLLDPDRRGKKGVQCLPKVRGCPMRRELQRGYLPGGMNPPVGASRSRDRDATPCGDPGENPFQLSLDGWRVGLELPPVEGAAIVVDRQRKTHGFRTVHGRKLPTGPKVSTCRNPRLHR